MASGQRQNPVTNALPVIRERGATDGPWPEQRLQVGVVAQDSVWSALLFRNIDTGAQVRIKDNGGKVLPIGALGTGQVVQDTNCEFTLSTDNSPTQRADVYSIGVSHRGDVSVKRADAQRIALTLG